MLNATGSLIALLVLFSGATSTPGIRTVSPTGVIVEGVRALVTDISPDTLPAELRTSPKLIACFAVNGRGPTPLRLYIPANATVDVDIYRRASKGLYVRVGESLPHQGRYCVFEAHSPGTFMALNANARKTAAPSTQKSLLSPISDAPEAKADWKLFRVAPETITGSMPLVLIHGMKTDRWAAFIHWATYSSEAAAFREKFQVWDFFHENFGINVAVGYSKDYPAFEESIVAYLDRFLKTAISHGVETDGVRSYFPAEGPFCLMSDSTGGLTALAFLRNFPDQAARIPRVIALSPTMTGTPGCTPEWLRHTTSRIQIAFPETMQILIQSSLANALLYGFMDERCQSDLDAGWANLDARGGSGIPTKTFRSWLGGLSIERITLSPRDANSTDARTLPGYNDNTFEPQLPLTTYCGGLDAILPATQGDPLLEKFYLYASYMDHIENIAGFTYSSSKALLSSGEIFLETLGALAANAVMTTVATQDSDFPLGTYLLNDGLVPLQSQLMLDGAQTEFIYETKTVNGWRFPVEPFRPRMNLIRRHTLANPDHLRLLINWTHLDTVTGRYNVRTKSSTLFSMVAKDLISIDETQ